MKNGPLFSVVIPTMNRSDMCRRAVESVLTQSLQFFEIIVVDDYSDHEYPWLKHLLKDGRIRLLRNDIRRGPSFTRNCGLEAAKGEYLALLDDDDEYIETFLEATHAVLKMADSTTGVTWSGIQYVHDCNNGAPTDPVGKLQTFNVTSNDSDENLKTFLSIGTGYGICITRDCYKKVGGFNESLVTVEDTEWFLRIVKNGFSPVRVPGTHVVIHDHSEPKLTHEINNKRNLRECAWLLEAHADTFKRFPFLEKQLRGHMANVVNGRPLGLS